jgi:hypothetical protein
MNHYTNSDFWFHYRRLPADDSTSTFNDIAQPEELLAPTAHSQYSHLVFRDREDATIGGAVPGLE